MRNNNLSPLAFHENVNEQAHRMPYAYGEVFPLLYPNGILPPYQVIVPGGAALRGCTLCDENGKVLQNIDTDIFGKTGDGYKVMYSKIRQITGYPDGRYMIVLTVNNSGTIVNYYSDLFTWSNNLAGCVQLVWYNSENIEFDGGMICYENNYKNILYLNTEIGKPTYEFEEEGEERDGLFFASKQISSKKYNMTFLANEALCDVLRTVRLTDSIGILDQYGRTYRLTNFLITVKWQTQGDLASLEAEFETDTIIKNVGRAYEQVQPEIFGIELDKNEVVIETGKTITLRVKTILAWQEKQLLTN